MMNSKITLFIAVIFLAFACGQTNNTPTSNLSESVKDVTETKEKQQSINSTDTPSPKELTTNSSVSTKTKTENLKKDNTKMPLKNAVNAETAKVPKTVAVSQKVPKETELKMVEEVAENNHNEVVEPIDEEVTVNTAIDKSDTVIKTEKKIKNMEATPAFSHEGFDQLLRKNVSGNGKVNYNNLKADEAKLDAYLKKLDENPPASGWSKSKKMAYWINAYNAATIKLILKNYPVSSITKLHGGKPWDQKWVPLGGKTYSLNNIENDILRPVYKDARIHFAVNCAAKSCPPLLNRAWTESNLNKYLEQQTKAFINDAAQNKITVDAVEISKIFEWYAVDFGNIIDFLNKYSDVKINSGAKITYREYNWDLNK